MNRPVAPIAEAVGVLLALALAGWCAARGVTTSEFGPIAPDAPSFTSVHYVGSWITAAFASVLVAGLLALDIARRRRSCRYPQGVL
ncbi:hypothetical protein ERC79_06860 [Rhodococcus sp. ABRD24]|uniref:hypothetical protein n=1 Tax=Rhodococcus sp. ABRD24 TaxID=2507582 RepID=UPI00103A34FF|nr:hypothetical protein [Rhodococcus sp. ABRD24]QBJ95718.1 hypothetical protein ERC79_06860 [Rhodococcus sp. ABRD24]